MLYFTKLGAAGTSLKDQSDWLITEPKLFLDCFFLIKNKKVYVRKATEQLLYTKYMIKLHPYTTYRNQLLNSLTVYNS